MNVYFLVEGRSSERKLYPQWLKYACPHLKRLNSPAAATKNSYYLMSAEGHPSIIGQHLTNAIKDIEASKAFDLFVLVLDADEFTVQDRIDEVNRAVQHSEVKLKSARLEVIVQNRCIETWLLGNRRIFTRQPQSPELQQYITHYDVEQNDPEVMPLKDGFNTHSQFHYQYLSKIFEERYISYSKRYPRQAGDKTYFEQLKSRVEDTNHIQTFGHFLRLCESFVS